jgi:hypothetical protein
MLCISYGGAVTDQSIVAQSSPATQSFRDQVDNFLTYYSKNSSLASWDDHNSLFAVFFGAFQLHNMKYIIQIHR